MKKIWFKAKRYGYGWVPATKEGWLVVCIYVVLFAAAEIIFTRRINLSHDSREVFWFIPFIFFITAILIWVSYKYGEPARWRWGGDDK